jgi:peptidoglycan/LPS O-acetylase OafA/YrhL
VGVDVFFVISGFLITSILIDELERDDFSITRFYERRARRILPALFVVLLACIPFAWMWMLPAEFTTFCNTLVSVVLFVSNILLSQQSGYFDTAAELKPLLHTWSLAVEEQYYLLFPLFLLMLWRFGRNRVFWSVVAIASVSLLLSEYGWRHHPNSSANFFLAHTRVWELLAGSICAFLTVDRTPRASDLLSTAGLALIVFSIFYYDSSTPFPSLSTLAPVVGTALVLLYAQRNTFVGRLLSKAPLVGIGLISYSAYLWHQPLFAFARIRSLTEPSQTLMAGLAIASLLLAIVTWKYVEQPFRKQSGSVLASRKSVFAASAAVGSALVAVGVAGNLTKGFEGRLTPEMRTIAKAKDDKPAMTCYFEGVLPKHPRASCYFANSRGDVDVLLTGDSHSWAVSRELGKMLRSESIGFYDVSYGGCVPLSGLVPQDGDRNCAAFVENAKKYARQAGITVIVLTARFPLYLRGEWFNNGEGGRELGKRLFFDLIDMKSSTWDDKQRRVRVLNAYEQRIVELASEFKVVLVYPIPEAGWDVPMTVFKNAHIYGKKPELSISFAAYKERTAEVNTLFDKLVAELPNVYGARVYEALCSEDTGRCINADANGIYYYDDDHLSNAGARRVVPIIVDAVKQALQAGGGRKAAIE